jgi:hypothetical protein
MAAATRIADGSDVIDVHAEAQLARLCHRVNPARARPN